MVNSSRQTTQLDQSGTVKMPRRVLVGVVKSDRVSQLRRVEIERLVRHKKYKKIIRNRTVCHAHDADNVSSIGDRVEIEETPPMSKLKRWRVVRVVEKNKEVDLASMKARRSEAAGSDELTAVVGE